MENVFTEEQVKEMLIKAFLAGENYGVAYGGWFNPTLEERSLKAGTECNKIYNEELRKDRNKR